MLARLPLILFVLACALIAFGYGLYVGASHDYPYGLIRRGVVTLQTLLQHAARDPERGQFARFSEHPAAEAAARRIRHEVAPEAAETLLWSGGRNQFLEHCPENGCLAVEIDKASSEVRHAYPYRPQEIFAADPIAARPYETPPGYDVASAAHPIGIARYADGDLLAVFQAFDIFPFGAGVARLDRDGHPRWLRRDYSHHWPYVMPDGRALVAGTRLRGGALTIPLSPNKHLTLSCDSGTTYEDTVVVLAPDGSVLREISVLDAVAASPYRAVLEQSTDSCDPVHLNFIRPVDENLARAVAGLAPGDFIVSLRNVSAFGFIDKDDGRLKRLVRGTFLQQHGVQHLRDGAFLMFDNHGGDAEGGPSRLLRVDLVNGRETTVFPTRRHGKNLQSLFSLYSGALDVSADRRRAIVTFTEDAKAFEIRLEDGEILTVFNNLHDVASVPAVAGESRGRAAAFHLFGIDYLPAERRP